MKRIVLILLMTAALLPALGQRVSADSAKSNVWIVFRASPRGGVINASDFSFGRTDGGLAAPTYFKANCVEPLTGFDAAFDFLYKEKWIVGLGLRCLYYWTHYEVAFDGGDPARTMDKWKSLAVDFSFGCRVRPRLELCLGASLGFAVKNEGFGFWHTRRGGRDYPVLRSREGMDLFLRLRFYVTDWMDLSLTCMGGVASRVSAEAGRSTVGDGYYAEQLNSRPFILTFGVGFYAVGRDVQASGHMFKRRKR